MIEAAGFAHLRDPNFNLLSASCHIPEQLGIADERRGQIGAAFLASLGARPLYEFLLQVVREQRDVAGMLDLLDQWRDGLNVDVMKVHGGDRFPPRPLREVP